MSITIAIPKFKKDLLRIYMQSKYTASLRRAGAKAVWIEPDDLDQAIEKMLQCDGLLLSGGEDVDPNFYGQPGFYLITTVLDTPVSPYAIYENNFALPAEKE